MKKNNNKTLELTDLQQMLLSICSNLNRPIRKSQLIKMVTDLFEANTEKQVTFALLDMIEQGLLCQHGYFIVTPEFFKSWNGITTAADEGIIKFLLCLKDDAKYYTFFDVFSCEHLTPNLFFRYIHAVYPALLKRDSASLAYMQQIENTFPYGLSNDFYVEMNDYKTPRWFTDFFDNKDCRIFIYKIEVHKKYAILQLMLLPGRRRNYDIAHQQYEEFQQHIASYFDGSRHIHCKSTLLTMRTGTNIRKRH